MNIHFVLRHWDLIFCECKLFLFRRVFVCSCIRCGMRCCYKGWLREINQWNSTSPLMDTCWKWLLRWLVCIGMLAKAKKSPTGYPHQFQLVKCQNVQPCGSSCFFCPLSLVSQWLCWQWCCCSAFSCFLNTVTVRSSQKDLWLCHLFSDSMKTCTYRVLDIWRKGDVLIALFWELKLYSITGIHRVIPSPWSKFRASK